MAMGTSRVYFTSNATRLLSAGAYLEKQFRKRVIHELVDCRFRFVAPSYGCDAVTVLAHALAARRLEREQAAGVVIGLVIDVREGVLGLLGGLLIAAWAVWALAFLRRAATLRALGRLRTARPVGDYPASRALTPGLVAKITREQQGSGDTILYGGYFPFVGAGWPLPGWSIAELLIPARPGPAVIPFTVIELSEYIAKGLREQLQGDVVSRGRVQHLTIERRSYSGAGLAPVRSRTDAEAVEFQDGRERYDATREYLCIRVGAWGEELVLSMFVGFDLRGNTLYFEFPPCVLPPVRTSFHLVDRLPARLTPQLLLRVAWHVPFTLIRGAFAAVVGGAARLVRWGLRQGRAAVSLEPVFDNSEFRLGRYAPDLTDRGARFSVRELAAASQFHHFFQEEDQAKYVKIVERQLLAIMGEFLTEHNVDLGD